MLAKECMKRGLLVLRLGYFGNRLNLMPSLDSSRAEMEFIFDILDESLTVTKRLG
jgi:4-aminobutyrate aminotransferase-like enzyme